MRDTSAFHYIVSEPLMEDMNKQSKGMYCTAIDTHYCGGIESLQTKGKAGHEDIIGVGYPGGERWSEFRLSPVNCEWRCRDKKERETETEKERERNMDE